MVERIFFLSFFSLSHSNGMGYLVLDTRWEKVEEHGAFEGICVFFICIYLLRY
jgi:hypothetical protein